MESPWMAAARLMAESLRRRVSLKSLAISMYSRAPRGFKAEVRSVAVGAVRNFMLLDRLLLLAGANIESMSLERLCYARVLAYLLKLRGASLNDPKVGEVARASRLDGRSLKMLGRLEVEDAYAGLEGLDKLSIKYSMPMWILESLVKVGAPRLEPLLRRLQRDPSRWIRVSTHRVTREELVRRLSRRGFKLKADSDLDDVLQVLSFKGGITETPEYRAGLYHVQDKASVLVGHVARSEVGVHVDLTGGPGGKITHLAQLERYGVACDVSMARCSSIRELARRLRVAVDAVLCDSRLPPLRLRGRSIVLVDPPCTNLGRLCYEPEVKAWMTEDMVREFAKLQRSLLRAAAEAAPRGTVVVYSVCTFTRDECERVVEDALSLGLEPVDQRPFIGEAAAPSRKAQRLYPHIHDTAGFYIAKLVKV
ncbi:16S rRNA methyltransferase [Candidatus Geothermarchaeota archaeon ex4572_27]|nr:MAG: 16S rRNA methyltransferase [Candidatus Geothermarchaeota archaeon ex4572_27]